MIDLQSEIIEGGIEIDRVGIKGLSYPILVKDKLQGSQYTVAKINMYVNLPNHFRGAHMSRFLEILHQVGVYKINRKRIKLLLLNMKEILSAKAAHLEIFFPYFVKKPAPISKVEGLNEYQCGLYGSHDENNNFSLVLEVNAMVLNLCPCSRELSPNTSAHNQRGRATVKIKSGPLIWIEDVIEIIESSASSPIYSTLKRVDEKYVMDNAHNKPRFVEDIVREIAFKLTNLDGILWYCVECENFESIHNHNAYAMIEKGNHLLGSQ
jgi:GTP cyclohydrolase IB